MNGERERSELVGRADAIAPWLLDGLLALFVLAPTLALAKHGINRGDTSASTAGVVSASILSTLPLLDRRRRPVEVLALTLLFGVAIPSAAVLWPPSIVAVYTIASRRPRKVAFWSAVVAAVAFDVHRLVWGYDVPLFGAIAGVGLTGAALALGLYQATRLAYFDQTRERAARLERERELLDEQAAVQERLRIARELHDVVAHNVSLIVIQAQALEATAEDARAARRGAQTIAELARDAMGEMHRTLELMRREDGGDEERSPQPALSDLGPLLDRANAAGVNVDVSVTGPARQLSAGVELSAYRIVQEALTNVIKHSHGDRASVDLHFRNDALELEIADNGTGVGEPDPARAGHGLVGMRERAALFGGDLEAGPRNGRGYVVRATLPYAR